MVGFDIKSSKMHLNCRFGRQFVQNLFGVNLPLLSVLVWLVFSVSARLSAANISITANTNWSAITTGSGVGGLPDATDNITLQTNNATLTVDIAGAVCNDLTVGASNKTATVQITTAGNSLTVNGDLKMNTNDNAKTYILDAGPGTITIAGTFSHWGTSGTNSLRVSTGSLIFTPAVALSSPNQDVTFTGAGTMTFNGDFSDSEDLLTTFAGCTVNFGADYTYSNNSNSAWNASSTANFTGVACNFSNTMAGRTLTLGNITVDNNAQVTFLNSGGNYAAGSITLSNSNADIVLNVPLSVTGDVTVGTSGMITLNAAGANLTVWGSWTNNSGAGALTAGGRKVIFAGIAKSIGGTDATTFGPLEFGSGANNATYVLSAPSSCTSLTFTAAANLRTLTHSTATDILTVNGSVTINQPTAAVTNAWNIDAGGAVVTGNLTFSGTSATTTFIASIAVTSGTFQLDGTITWMGNTAVATEVISVTTGTITFNSSITMGSNSGTLKVTSTGTIDFNSAAAPSFTFGGAATVPVFTTTFGCNIRFKTGFTNNTNALVIANGSTTTITGSGTLNCNADVTFGNIVISSGTLTLGTRIYLTNNWTNSGTLDPTTKTVNFIGTGSQTITRTGGETFYTLTANTTGPIILANDVTITTTLNMTAGNLSLNGNTLTLGNSAAATLTRTAGIAYGGTFKRWLPAATISSTAGSLYGLFPIGTSTEYRPVEINTPVTAPTIAGYLAAIHTDALTVTDVSYLDNETQIIERISDMTSTLSLPGGLLDGGTYNIYVTFTDLSATGTLTDLKLETYTGASMGSVGTTSLTGGSVSDPVVKRTGLALADLANVFVVGTIDKNPTIGSPIRQYYYSRRNGDWTDDTPTNATWSYIAGGGGATCDCFPAADAYVVVSPGQTVTVDAISTADNVIIQNTGTLTGGFGLTVAKDITTEGSGKFTPSAAWSVNRDVTMAGSGNSSASASLTIAGDLNVGSNTILTMSGGAALSVAGDLTIDGTVALGTSTLTVSKVGGELSNSGSGSITGSGAIAVTENKTIPAGTTFTVEPTFAIVGAKTVSNSGTVILSGDLTGSVAGSTWTNLAGGTLNIAGTLLATGTLDADEGGNTVNYNGAGAQAIKTPTPTQYDNLTISNAGTKSIGSNFSVNTLLTIENSAILDAVTYTLNGGGGLTMRDNSQLKIQKNGNITFPELTGAYNLTGGTIHLAQTFNTPVIKGVTYYNLILDGSRSFTASSLGSVTNDLTIQGTATMASNAALAVGGNLSYTSGTTVTLSNDVIVTGSSTLNGGTFDLNNNDFTTGSLTLSAGTLISDNSSIIEITGAGGWTNNGGTFDITPNPSTVKFTGSVAQTIGGTQSTTFNNLILNNTFGTIPQITLGNNLVVDGTLTMTTQAAEWAVNLAGFTLTLGTAVGTKGTLSHDGTSLGGWFYGGNVKRWFSASTVADDNTIGLFPIGSSAADGFSPMYVSAPSTAPTTGGTINCSFTDPNTITDVSFADGVSTVQKRHDAVWALTTADGLAGGTYNLRADMEFLAGDVGTINDLRLILSGSVVGTAGTNAGTPTLPRVKRTGLTLAQLTNNFYIGSIDPTNSPLPIELLFFGANLEKENVLLLWTTATETNNDYFTIERTLDGFNFETVAIIAGAGNSTSLNNYSAVDENPYAGISYYRLKQTDYDGKFSYSDLVPIEVQRNDIEFSVFPNPSYGDNLFFQINSSSPDNKVSIVIYDNQGKEYYSKDSDLNMGENIIAVDNPEKLSTGVYLIRISHGNSVIKRKLVIK